MKDEVIEMNEAACTTDAGKQISNEVLDMLTLRCLLEPRCYLSAR